MEQQQITAYLKNYRSSARKARLVVDLVRGKPVSEARRVLKFSSKKAAKAVLKLLNSAVSNAQHNYNVSDVSQLKISKITVDEGRTIKNWKPVSRGRAHPILKRSSHIKVILSEKSEARNSKLETNSKS